MKEFESCLDPTHPTHPTQTAMQRGSDPTPTLHAVYTDPTQRGQKVSETTVNVSNTTGKTKKPKGKKSADATGKTKKPKGKSKEPKGKKSADATGQNNIAAMIAPSISENLIFDSVSQNWHSRESNIWKPVEQAFARRAITRELEKVKSSFSHGYMTGVASFIKDSSTITGWSESPDELPMKNGVFVMSEKQKRDYEPTDFFNWQLPYEYTTESEFPHIKSALETWCDNDRDMYNFLLAWLYCVLTRRSKLQKYIELIGKGGTGKSSFMDLCTMLVGEKNRAVTGLRELETNKFESSSLYGKSLTLITDSERYFGQVSQLKRITGGDPIRHEAKYARQTEPFVYRGMVMIATNEPIQSSDYTSGLSRRRIPVFFNRVLTTEEKNKYDSGIENVFRSEAPALINHLLNMSEKTVDATIRTPGQKMQNEATGLEIATNPILGWLDDRIIYSQGDDVQIGTVSSDSSTHLFPNYITWCNDRNIEPVAHKRFSSLIVDQLTTRGIQTRKKRSNGGYKLLNLKLRKITDKEETIISGSEWRQAGD